MRFVIEGADLPGHPAGVIARRHEAMLEAHLAALPGSELRRAVARRLAGRCHYGKSMP